MARQARHHTSTRPGPRNEAAAAPFARRDAPRLVRMAYYPRRSPVDHRRHAELAIASGRPAEVPVHLARRDGIHKPYGQDGGYPNASRGPDRSRRAL